MSFWNVSLTSYYEAQYLWKTRLCLRNRTIWKVSRRHYRRRSMTAVLDHFQYTSDCMSPSTLIRWVMFALHHWCPSLMWCWPAYSTCNLQNCSVKREFQGSKMHWYRDRTLGQSFRIIKACPIQKTGNFVNLCKGAIFKTDREWAVRSSVYLA